MKEVKRIAYVKEGRNWKEVFTDTDQTSVYRCLAADLTAKFITKASYVTRLKRENNFDGTATITVWYDNGTKNVYTAER